MSYHDLLQLYFERGNAMQNYWSLYVVILGGVLAFSSMRKQPAPITTALVCLLFALFAYENLGALHDVTAQRFALLEAVKNFQPTGATPAVGQIRALLEPTLTPANWGSVKITHLTSDILAVAALIAMEFRRRRLTTAAERIR